MMEQVTFTPPKPLDTAVLFLVFNRLDVTKQVFKAIRQAKPPRLYIAADGARNDKVGELEKVALVRDYITTHIDWNCEVSTLFRDKNLGCKYAVSSAITWFFENEEQGIILEDDCLPSQSFFWFCEELLEKYKSDSRIWHISGDNFQKGIKRGEGDYYFSKFNHIWGWASWANRWDKYDVEMEDYDNFKHSNQIDNVFNKNSSRKYWNDIFGKVSKNEIDTWDYQWTFTILSNSGLSILPNKNLISNIGFGAEATHTFDLESEFSELEKEELTTPLVHPTFILLNNVADELTETKMFVHGNILRKIFKKIIRAAFGDIK